MQSKRSIDSLTEARKTITARILQQKDPAFAGESQQQDLRNRQKDSRSRPAFLAIPRLVRKVTQQNHSLRIKTSPEVRAPS